ncbi:MAG TPA: copper resistance CopC family protein [Chloroflexota bacterium]
MHILSRSTAVAGGVVLLLLLSAGLASAHSRYVSSTPGASATVASAPTSVTIVFSETIVAGTTASVTDASGATVSTGSQIVTSDPDRKTFTVALRPGLPNGVYKVSYVTNSDDGARLQGSFAFGVNAAVPASLAKTETELTGDAGAPLPAAPAAAAPAAPAAAPAAAAPPRPPPTQLPRTGGLPLDLLGAVGVALGALGLLARRRG